MSIVINRMLCDGCGKLIGWVNLEDLTDNVSFKDMKAKDECHNCRARRLNREAKNEVKEST